MMERVADRWGRGIRYGEDPDSLNESADALRLVEVRREAVASLTALGDSIAQAETMQAQTEDAARSLTEFGKVVKNFGQSQAGDLRLVRDVISSPNLDVIVQGVERLNPEALAAMTGSRDLTVTEFGNTLRRVHELVQRKNDQHREALRQIEERIRAMLLMIADRADRKVI